MKRISRACVRCRRHKAKCILQKSGHVLNPPCQKCVQAGVECVLATSNRGGYRRPRTGDVQTEPTSAKPSGSASQDSVVPEQPISWSSQTDPVFPEDQAGNVDHPEPGQNVGVAEGTSIDATIASTDLHHTSDALNILSQIAGSASANATSHLDTPRIPITRYPTISESQLFEYHLVSSGILTPVQVLDLVERFVTFYHPFYPIAPKHSLNRAFIPEISQKEPHLLTAMITIGAKDVLNGEPVLAACTQYMHTLIAGIAAGKKCGIEAVEALLLLAEWEPQCGLPESASLACGQEDMAAWMHIGLAIRLAYALKLDRTIFRNDLKNGRLTASRERLVWAACYLSDRQISIRIGRPFACRGLEPSIAYGKHGFPVVESENSRDEFSTVFQARLELNQIFTNVHEVLYCNLGAGTTMMLQGRYAVYLDDFRGAIATWNSLWGSLTCSHNVKVLMQLSYEYLRLYANSFAFQAAAFRTLSPNRSDFDSEVDRIKGPGSLPEARFMYESVDAAKALLTIVNNYLSTTENLNKFPIRFTLYCVNAAVFLYKIWTLNISSKPELMSIRRLVGDTIMSFRKGTNRATDLGARYARLLEVLWERADQRPGISDASSSFEHSTRPTPNLQEYVPYFQEGFSWLDLEAISDFVLGDTNRNEGLDFANMQQSIDSLREDIDWNGVHMLTGNEFSRIF